MSTSNSYNYSEDRDTLIRGALEICGVLDRGETLGSADVTVCNRVLNQMLKAWVTHGLHAWKRKVHIISPLVLNQQYYDLGTNPTDSVTAVGDGTTTVAITHAFHGHLTGDSMLMAGATGDTDINGTFDITVTSPSAYTYTALAVVDSGTEAGSVTATLQGAQGIPRPERILECNRINDGNRVEITELTNNEYRNLPNLTTAGTPIQYHYERKVGAGRFYIWNTANATSVSDDTIEIIYEAQIEDMDSSTDDLDLPQEWIEAVTHGLAYRISKRYGVERLERVIIRADAEEMLENAKNFDFENGSLYIQPEMR